jgi:hypothetical protein
MNICPICLFVNPDGTAACTRCGKFKFRENGVATATADDRQRVHATLYEGRGTPRSETSPSVLTRPSGSLKASDAHRAAVGCFDAPTKPALGSDTAADRATPLPGTRILVKPKLEVIRGEKIGAVYAVLEGKNLLGRTVNQPVDIDLTNQEPVERVWTSRQHTCIHFDGRIAMIEDLNSLNGTFVNRTRLFPGQQRLLQPNDVIQIGTVQMRLIFSTE